MKGQNDGRAERRKESQERKTARKAGKRNPDKQVGEHRKVLSEQLHPLYSWRIVYMMIRPLLSMLKGVNPVPSNFRLSVWRTLSSCYG